MAHQCRSDAELADFKVVTRHFVQEQPAGQIAQVNRKKRWGEVTGEAHSQTQRRTRRAPNMHLSRRVIERGEET
jgi:hypothetical protein